MSLVTALSLVLFVGFVTTGVIGLLGWRKRMRQGAGVSANQPQTGPTIITATRRRAMRRCDLEGARL